MLLVGHTQDTMTLITVGHPGVIPFFWHMMIQTAVAAAIYDVPTAGIASVSAY